MVVHSGSFYHTLEGTARVGQVKVYNIVIGIIRRFRIAFFMHSLSLHIRERPTWRQKKGNFFCPLSAFPFVEIRMPTSPYSEVGPVEHSVTGKLPWQWKQWHCPLRGVNPHVRGKLLPRWGCWPCSRAFSRGKPSFLHMVMGRLPSREVVLLKNANSFKMNLYKLLD